MDNNLNNQKKAVTGMDGDGNMQIRSSAKPDRRTPVRTPARAPKKQAPQTAAPKPAYKRAKRTAPQEADAREYSFATSGLFNNSLKDRATDPTAASEAKKLTPQAPVPSSGTKVMDTPPRKRASRSRGTPPPPQRPPVRGTKPPAGAPVRPAVQGDPRTVGVRKPPAPPSAPPAAKAPSPAPVQGDPRTVAVRKPPAAAPDMATRVNPVVTPPQGAPQPPVPPRAAKGRRPVQGEGASAKGANPAAKLTAAFSAMNSLTKSLIYIACVMIVSVILSAIVITNANDVFAFVKDEKTVELTIKQGTDLNDLAEMLKDKGIIEHKNTFKFFIKFRKKDSDSYAPGTYTVSSTMSYDQIISAITPRAEREQIRLTIPEGYTVDQIIDLFVEKDMGDRDEFVRVINEADLSDYWFVEELPEDNRRYYRLEGYLFPDTYYFYTDMSEETIIRKFLDNFDSKLTKTYREGLAKKGYTLDQVITLGSIVQAEGKERSLTLEIEEGKPSTYVDYGLISGVFHNRLELRTPMKLQSDATTQFALNMEGKSDAKLSDYTDADYTNPYNTYYCQGLPPGAICNPGLNAISFALEPDSCPFYYFISDSSGNTYFSKTVEEHLALVNSMKN